MKRSTLEQNVDANMAQTKEDLQLLWDNINQGQRKQLIKRENIKAILDRYGVEY